MRIGIVADDLTGAADSAAPFAGVGMRAVVWLKHDDGAHLPACDALALVTGARDADLHREERDEMVRGAVRLLLRHNPEVLYQKIDSTLRGDVAGELAALRTEARRRTVIVCPAFPANGRTLEGGRLSVHGEPWSQTAYAPAKLRNGDDTLLSVIGIEPAAPGAHIPLEWVRSGYERVRERLHSLIAEGVSSIACDAVTDDDLDNLTRAVVPEARIYLLVGSGGWTASLARHMGAQALPLADTRGFATGRVLVVIGSRHAVSRAQARILCEQTGYDPLILQHAAESERVAKEVLQLFGTGRRLVTVQSPDLDLEDSLKPAIPAFAEALRRAARSGSRGFEAVIVTGGETALQLCHGLHLSGLEITGEVAPGVVTARTIAGSEEGRVFDDLPLILKSGGFGAADLLASCVAWTGL